MVCLGYRLPYPSIRLGFQSDKDRGLSRQPYSTDLSIAAHDLRGHVARECQSLVGPCPANPILDAQTLLSRTESWF